MINFQLAGRLGNQLFQWATALKVQEIVQEVRLVHDDYHQSTPTATLRELVHGKIKIRKSNLIGRILQFEDRFLTESKVLKSFIQTESDPYGIFNAIPRNTKILRGFFQNWQNVSQSEQTIKDELSRVADNLLNRSAKLLKLSNELEDFNAVHIRIGDYKNSRFGVLSPEFYSSIKRKLNGPVAVFTDQNQLPEEYIVALNPDYIFTPESLSSEESFVLMSYAKSLVIANSTFSWWSGFLVLQNDCEVIIPDPWLKDGTSGSALAHPRMVKAESLFI